MTPKNVQHPRLDEKRKRVNMTLRPSTVLFLREIGNGNASYGIEKLRMMLESLNGSPEYDVITKILKSLGDTHE